MAAPWGRPKTGLSARHRSGEGVAHERRAVIIGGSILVCVSGVVADTGEAQAVPVMSRFVQQHLGLLGVDHAILHERTVHVDMADSALFGHVHALAHRFVAGLLGCADVSESVRRMPDRRDLARCQAVVLFDSPGHG